MEAYRGLVGGAAFLMRPSGPLVAFLNAIQAKQQFLRSELRFGQ